MDNNDEYPKSPTNRLNADSDELCTTLTKQGFALLENLLTPEQCQQLAEMYSENERFRSHIQMARYRFGQGEYKYFAYPLPPLLDDLRKALYAKLAPTANQWAEWLGENMFYPPTLEEMLAECHAAGQVRPTPLLLRYHAGDYNCLHQDIYGAIAFPFQVVLFLSKPGEDYTGGEFLLTEQVPRAQTIGRALLPKQGDALIITTRHRPVRGTRGFYRATIRHGVSMVTSGERWVLGLIFHDAE